MTLLWQIQQGQSSRADGGSIVGPPTLPAETVDKIFASVGSPMVGTGKVVEQAARQANIDDAFALAVWWVETNDGQAGVGLNNRNPGAVQGTNGYILYPSYADAASDWFTMLRSRYVNRGLVSVYTICYPYVGTSHSLEWANKVVSYMLRYRNIAPAPTPVPTRDHAPISLQFAPSFGPASDKNDAAREVPQTTATGTQPLTNPLFSTQGSLLLMISGLLVALALLGVGVRRRATKIQPVEPVTESLAPATALPPLYVNEYSPIAEPASSPSLPWLTQWKQSQIAREAQPVATPISSAEGFLAATGAGQVSAARGHFLPFTANPASVIDGVPQLSFDDPVSAIDGVPQLSFDMPVPAARQAGNYPISFKSPSTEALPSLYRPGLSLPGRSLEPVPAGLSQQGPVPELVAAGARPARAEGGLLRRYAMEQASEK